VRIVDWLENHWVAPAYSGWVLIGLSICFLAAAINTMAGWLYVLSGLSLALLVIAALLPSRSLSGIAVRRHPISPVTAGDQLKIELEIANQTGQAKTLLQVQDVLPYVLGQTVPAPIEILPPRASHCTIYYHPTQRRGLYRWQTVLLRTATPLGLFWCCRRREVPVTAIVYPTVLPLTICPMVDEIGQEDRNRFYSQERRFEVATEGMTRSLRPYRLGDPTRLIHWRTSARYGELRVRELEVVKGGQEIIIALDSAATWQEDNFEQAVIAAASLYFYSYRQQLNVKIWTALTGTVQGERAVLEALAETEAGQETSASHLPRQPMIWLSQNPLSLGSLPPGSRWILWSTIPSPIPELVNHGYRGLVIQTNQPLQLQLQRPMRAG